MALLPQRGRRKNGHLSTERSSTFNESMVIINKYLRGERVCVISHWQRHCPFHAVSLTI